MSDQGTITHSDLTNLLANGAFLRDGVQVLLLWGPFTAGSSDKTHEISVCCPFFYESERLSFLYPARSLRVSCFDFSRQLLRFIEETASANPSFKWVEPEKADFERAFARVQNLISEGQIDKAVPVVFARAQALVTPAVRARWMMEALSSPDNLNPYGFWSGDEGVLGATPEILFSVEGRGLKTMAMAGTLAKTDGTAEDLARSSKDQYEHRLVVEDIKKELRSFGRVTVGATDVVALPALYHLRTEIGAELETPPDIAGLIARLHPTAALGVFPRLFGWRWMRELPGQEDRARFGAPFTVRLSPERAISLVGIRNVQWKNDRVMLGSGCGVVKASELESEWTELRRKRQSVLSILGMSS